jgi:hypothetical protein
MVGKPTDLLFGNEKFYRSKRLSVGFLVHNKFFESPSGNLGSFDATHWRKRSGGRSVKIANPEFRPKNFPILAQIIKFRLRGSHRNPPRETFRRDLRIDIQVQMQWMGEYSRSSSSSIRSSCSNNTINNNSSGCSWRTSNNSTICKTILTSKTMKKSPRYLRRETSSVKPTLRNDTIMKSNATLFSTLTGSKIKRKQSSPMKRKKFSSSKSSRGEFPKSTSDHRENFEVLDFSPIFDFDGTMWSKRVTGRFPKSNVNSLINMLILINSLKLRHFHYKSVMGEMELLASFACLCRLEFHDTYDGIPSLLQRKISPLRRE